MIKWHYNIDVTMKQWRKNWPGMVSKTSRLLRTDTVDLLDSDGIDGSGCRVGETKGFC